MYMYMELFEKGQLIRFDSIHHDLFDVSVEFMQNYIYESDQKDLILKNLQNLYVFLVPYNIQFKNLLDIDLYKISKKYGYFISGFILLDVSAKTDKVQYIDYIDTRIKKHNLANYMIELYEKDNNIKLIPFDILETACRYWKKYFEKKYNINDLDELETLKKTLEIKHKVCWEYLFKLY